MVPQVGTSDIANVGGTMLGTFKTVSEWTLYTFGVPLTYLAFCFALFLSLYAARHYFIRQTP